MDLVKIQCLQFLCDRTARSGTDSPVIHFADRRNFSRGAGEEVKRSLVEIEKDVLGELISAHSDYKTREDELVELAMSIRDLVVKSDADADGEDLFKLLSRDI